jgi:ribonuclease-3
MTKDEVKKLRKFCEIIKVKFHDLEFLKIALTHRSYLNEYRKGSIQHNERLEFLGDATLELLVSKHLYDKYPSRAEGDLTSFRAATVRTESLAEEALKLSVGEFIYMSKGEASTGGRKRPYILANTFEAIIGALYLDSGLRMTEKFLKHALFYKIPKIVENRLDIDNKSKLQEISQEILRETPTYEIVKSVGPDHAKRFTARVIIKKKAFGHGRGKSKREAEQEAASNALEDWKMLVAKYFNID